MKKFLLALTMVLLLCLCYYTLYSVIGWEGVGNALAILLLAAIGTLSFLLLAATLRDWARKQDEELFLNDFSQEDDMDEDVVINEVTGEKLGKEWANDLNCV